MFYEIGLVGGLIFIIPLFYLSLRWKFIHGNIFYLTLLIYLLIEAQFSHDLSFLRNILIVYFIIMFEQEKILSKKNHHPKCIYEKKNNFNPST